MIWRTVPCNKGFTKLQFNLPYLGYNRVLGSLEIGHGPVCDVLETGLYPLLREHTFFRISSESTARNKITT